MSIWTSLVMLCSWRAACRAFSMWLVGSKTTICAPAGGAADAARTRARARALLGHERGFEGVEHRIDMGNSLGFEEFAGEGARAALRQHLIDERLVVGGGRPAERQRHPRQLEIEEPPAAGLAPVVGPLRSGEGDQFE